MKTPILVALALGSFVQAQDCGGGEETATLTGQVRAKAACSNGPAQPVNRARVDVYEAGAGGAPFTYGFTDSAGVYRFDLDQGTWRLEVFPPSDYPVELMIVLEGSDVVAPTVEAKTVFAAGQVLVDFYDDVTEEEIIRIGAEAGVVTLDPLSFANIWLVGLAEEEHVTEGIETFLAFPEVEYAEPNYLACPM